MSADHQTHGYAARKDAYLKRLRRIEGQVRGLQRMVDEDTTASTSSPRSPPSTKALQSVALGLLDEHLGHCVASAPASRAESRPSSRRPRRPSPASSAADSRQSRPEGSLMSTTSTYAVEGMTCAHCVAAVTDEITMLRGVRDVAIDLVAGGVSALARDERRQRSSVAACLRSCRCRPATASSEGGRTPVRRVLLPEPADGAGRRRNATLSTGTISTVAKPAASAYARTVAGRITVPVAAESGSAMLVGRQWSTLQP